MSSLFENLVVGDDGRLPIQNMYEGDLDFCKRAFGGKEFDCVKCGGQIFWPGVCDKCDEIIKREKVIARGPLDAPGKMEKAGVPSAYLEWTWMGCDMPSGTKLSKLREWQGDPPILSFVGPAGTGKTGVGVCFIHDWIEMNNRARWIYVPDWLDYMRWLESNGDGSYPEFQRVAGLKGLIVLDELVTKRSTNYGIDKTLQILDARIRENLPTIITTNLPIDGKNGVAAIDERMASRINGGRVEMWVGNDRRRG